MKPQLIVLIIAVLFAGCTVGPNYKRPAVAPPPDYRGTEGTPTTASASIADQKWWDVFQDETLRGLIDTALKQNYDVQIAAARIEEARAQLGVTRANQLPTVVAGAAAVNERIPRTAHIPSIETSANQLNISLAWELDFWGKYRRGTESARASLLAQEWAKRAVMNSLVSEVASAYFQLREMDLELEISRQTLTNRQDSLRLTQLLADRGSTSLLDVKQAEQLVFTASGSIADLERRIEQQENFISVLLGTNPRAVARGRRLTDEPHATQVPAGLPSDLLERRPDIRAAEEQLVAANAQIGVAKAAYFPEISLTGVGGYQSSALTGLFSGPAGLWTFGGSAVQPIFEGGRLRNRTRLAEASTNEAALVYQKTVQQAFREVSDSLVGYRKSQEFRAQQEQLTHSAEEATKLSDMRYRGGAASYLEVLDSNTRYFSAQLSLAQAQLAELQSLVQIYRSLGGGWQ